MTTCKQLFQNAHDLKQKYYETLHDLDATLGDGHLSPTDVNDPKVSLDMLALAQQQLYFIESGIKSASGDTVEPCYNVFGGAMAFGDAASFQAAVEKLDFALKNLRNKNISVDAFPLIPFVSCSEGQILFGGADYDEIDQDQDHAHGGDSDKPDVEHGKDLEFSDGYLEGENNEQDSVPVDGDNDNVTDGDIPSVDGDLAENDNDSLDNDQEVPAVDGDAENVDSADFDDELAEQDVVENSESDVLEFDALDNDQEVPAVDGDAENVDNVDYDDTDTDNVDLDAIDNSDVIEETPNHAPTINAVDDAEIAVGQTYQVQHSAIDPDNDVLTFSGRDLPRGATIDSQTGEFQWRPTCEDDQIGAHSFQVCASDGEYEACNTNNIEAYRPAFPMERIPKAYDGSEPNHLSGGIISVSGNGRFIAFQSSASDLLENPTVGGCLYVYDLKTKQVDRVSVGFNGEEPNGISMNPSISHDGRFVAFNSYATNLLEQPSSPKGIYVFDRQTHETELIADIADPSYSSPRISPDGRYVGFSSFYTNSVPDDTNNTWDTFLYDRVNETLELVSRNSNGEIGNDQSSRIALSSDAMDIAFSSVASNMLSGNQPHRGNVFVKNRESGITELASATWNGSLPDSHVQTDYHDGHISSDGRFLAFVTSATNMVVNPDTNEVADVYFHDRTVGDASSERISIGLAGQEPNGRSFHSTISDDGRFVVFQSAADNLTEGDTNGVDDAFVYDRVRKETRRVSIGPDGHQSDIESRVPMISGDGTIVAFVGQNVFSDATASARIYITGVECLFSGPPIIPQQPDEEEMESPSEGGDLDIDDDLDADLPDDDGVDDGDLDADDDFIEQDIPFTCDPDGDGIITERFYDPTLLNALRTYLDKEPNDDITVEDAENTTVLSLASNNINSISGLECFSELKQLNLWNNQIYDITPVTNLSKLEELNLHTNQISDISALANLPTLKTLNASRNQISDMSSVSYFPNLKNLRLAENSITDISSVDSLQYLESLDLALNDISDISPIADLINLNYLSLSGNNIEDITPISNLSLLKTLLLNLNQISSLESISELVSLETLSATNNQIEDISPVSNLTNIVTINLNYNEINDISPLSHLPNLTILELSWNNITDISPIASLQYLKNLQLGANNISDISSVSGLTNLSSLRLALNDIIDITPIAGLTTLDRLEIYGNLISNVSVLSGLTFVKILRIDSNEINDISSLEYMTLLGKLWINGNSITDITPLLNNVGIGEDDEVWLDGNEIPQEQINELVARGVIVN